MTVVGDDDQSIYGWRGADVRHILDFEHLWKTGRGSNSSDIKVGIHRLEENYRSTPSILKFANAIIHSNPDRHEKELRATREDGPMPEWMVCNDEYDEARKISRFFQSRRDQGVGWQDMAALYRSNRQSLALEQVLREEEMPYRIIGGVGFFERMEIKDGLSFWALLNGCADSMHLLRIMNKPKRGIGAKGQEKLVASLASSGLRAAEWLDVVADGGEAIAGKLQPLAGLVRNIRSEIETHSDRGLMALLEQSGYLESLQSFGEIEAESRIENIRTLQGYIELTLTEGVTPIEFMDRAALLQSGEQMDEQAAEEQNGQGDDQVISLMSLHRAKGLEFDSVVLAGVEDGLLPHQRSLDEGESGIAEERRLLYVGITRAENCLLLTSARQRRVFGDMHYPIPSRFIKNISPDILKHEKPAAVTIQPVEESGIYIGAGVRHPTFGEGVVLELEGGGDATRISIQFRGAGIKRLMLKYAALEVI